MKTEFPSAFKETSFIALLDADKERFGIDSDLFFTAFNEARLILDDELLFVRQQISPDHALENQDFIRECNSILLRIGFTGASLTLKMNVLNKLWDGVLTAGNGIINFASDPLVKAIRKFLSYLNSILGSLLKLIPGLDGVKEIKEVGEKYLDLAEE